MRAFPGWYEHNSVYALFPLTIPSKNKTILNALGKVSLYSFKRPSIPERRYILSTAGSALSIFMQPLAYRLMWDKAISRLDGVTLSAESRINAVADEKILKRDAPNGLDEIWDFYIKRTTHLLGTRSCRFNEYFQVDIIKEYALTCQC